ncbi:MAG: hypothetical protein RIR88_370 [Actinomycetota bacterium]
MSTHDEEALQWAGDNDERLSQSTSPKAPRVRRGASAISGGESIRASRRTASGEAHVDSTEDTGPVGLSSFALLAFGVLGGIYLLFSVAWLITVLRNPTQFDDPLGNFMFVAGLWMAMLTPAAWFGAVLYLGRAKPAWVRLLFLVVGAALVIPWPFITWAG